MKRLSKIYLVIGCNRILRPFTGLIKKLGIRLKKNICQKKEDKILLKLTGDNITIKKNGKKNS